MSCPAPRRWTCPRPRTWNPTRPCCRATRSSGLLEQVPVEEAAGRIVAETMSPYPPGVPAVFPGEVLTRPVLDYLRSGAAAGMFLPDPVDPLVRGVRVVAR